jgi:hypothetical protein
MNPAASRQHDEGDMFDTSSDARRQIRGNALPAH